MYLAVRKSCPKLPQGCQLLEIQTGVWKSRKPESGIGTGMGTGTGTGTGNGNGTGTVM